MESGQHTIRTVLKLTQDWFAGKEIPSARLDAEILLAHVLDLDRLGLYLDMERPLTAAELGAYRALVRRRGGREPVAYILGRKDLRLGFLGESRSFNPSARYRLLVELALKQLPTDRHVRVADVCTGSGCVAVAIAANREKAEVWATEIDEGARQVASKNIAAHELGERIHLAKGTSLNRAWNTVPLMSWSGIRPTSSKTHSRDFRVTCGTTNLCWRWWGRYGRPWVPSADSCPSGFANKRRRFRFT